MLPFGQAYRRALRRFKGTRELPAASMAEQLEAKTAMRALGQTTMLAAPRVVRRGLPRLSGSAPSPTACRCWHVLNQRNLADENRPDSPAL